MIRFASVFRVESPADDSLHGHKRDRFSGNIRANSKGPFTGFVATIETIAPDRRVWVLIEIMGGETRVAVSAEQLRAV